MVALTNEKVSDVLPERSRRDTEREEKRRDKLQRTGGKERENERTGARYRVTVVYLREGKKRAEGTSSGFRV